MVLKVSAHRNSGRLMAHDHTSYALLAILVLLTGLILAAFTITNFASAIPGPQAGSIGLSGTMPENPPSTAASITTPSNQQQFATTPITVGGNCPVYTLVEIYKNSIFAGSTPCNSNGTYSVQIDLLYGQNALTATDYDVLNQAGPVSNVVAVSYNAQAPPIVSSANVNFSGAQLLLIADAIYRGVFPGQQLNVPITILGGVAPFALNVEWGDNTNQVLPSSNNTTVNATHAYTKPGTYKITIQGSDSQGRIAFLSVAAVVNGQPAATPSSTIGGPTTNKLLILWPMYAISATLVVSFWLGEKREKHILANAVKSTPSLGHLS